MKKVLLASAVALSILGYTQTTAQAQENKAESVRENVTIPHSSTSKIENQEKSKEKVEKTDNSSKIDDKEEKFLLHRTKEEDDDRTRIYKGLEMDGAIMYGKPDRIPPLWLHGIMEMEMEFLHNVLQGAEVDKEFIPLLDGTAARDSILTADALTKSLEEDRKVKISELL